MSVVQDIAGKVALVTGGSSGLGAAIARRLGEAGARVFVLGRNQDGLDETVEAVRAAGGAADAICGDLAEAGFITSAVERVATDAGRINVLVNNAAIMYMDAARDMERSRCAAMFDVNVLAVIEGAQAAIKRMRADNVEGHIVSVSSLASRLVGGGVYGATKAALETFMEQLRLELEDDPIRVTTIVPGGFSTNLGRNLSEGQQQSFRAALGKMGEKAAPDADGRLPFFGVPDDIARAVVFAVAQPIYLNVFEMVVRPAKNIDPAQIME